MEPGRKPILQRDDSLWFAAGRLCLDFVNSSCMRLGKPLELLDDREALDLWLAAAGRIHGEDFPRVAGHWHAQDERSLARAHELRTALWKLFEGVLLGQAPDAAAMDAVNAVLMASPTYSWLDATNGQFFQSIEAVQPDDPWLDEVARDAVDFLCFGDLKLLRQCECETCVRVFYDTTKNHKRRWCVERCGSRVKAAKYYRRKRESARTAADAAS